MRPTLNKCKKFSSVWMAKIKSSVCPPPVTGPRETDGLRYREEREWSG